MRHAVPTVLLAAVLAGCGGASTPSPPHETPSGRVAAAPVKVGATQLRLGDATTADDHSGARQLPVGPRRVVPDDLRPHGRRDGVGAGASCADQDLLPDASNLGAVSAATLCLLNGERADAGLAPLQADAKLSAASRGHSQDMVDRQYFDHGEPGGRDLVARVRAVGFIDPKQGWMVGENIAWGSGTLSTPASIVAAWMASPGHRENLLNRDYREIGIGIVPGSPRARDLAGAATYTTDFGTIGDPRAKPVAVAAIRRAPRLRRLRAHHRRAVHRRGLAARSVPVRARIALGPKASPPGQ
jgi:uncharacterized protein YkwD